MPLDIQAGIQRPKIDMHCHVWYMDDWETSSDHLVHAGEMLGITELWCSSIISNGILSSIEEVRPHNDTILKAMARHPKRIRGWCFVIPGHFNDALHEIERCLDGGMIGIKLYNQYHLNDPAVHPVLELASERRLPILQHAGYLVPEHRASQPLISHGIHFTDASEKYPDAILFHAHIGGGGDWEHTVREMRNASPNVYIDISGSNLDDGQVEYAVAELGAERVLFGTDGTMAGAVGKVLDADLTEEERELIFWGNAERILKEQGVAPTEPRTEGTPS
ncbi:MAG: amidohydrolase family protein [bacterium]|nr:amidohydrolase family protein [bacterium]